MCNFETEIWSCESFIDSVSESKLIRFGALIREEYQSLKLRFQIGSHQENEIR